MIGQMEPPTSAQRMVGNVAEVLSQVYQQLKIPSLAQLRGSWPRCAIQPDGCEEEVVFQAGHCEEDSQCALLTSPLAQQSSCSAAGVLTGCCQALPNFVGVCLHEPPCMVSKQMLVQRGRSLHASACHHGVVCHLVALAALCCATCVMLFPCWRRAQQQICLDV